MLYPKMGDAQVQECSELVTEITVLVLFRLSFHGRFIREILSRETVVVFSRYKHVPILMISRTYKGVIEAIIKDTHTTIEKYWHIQKSSKGSTA